MLASDGSCRYKAYAIWLDLPRPTRWCFSSILDSRQVMKAKWDGYWCHFEMNCSRYVSLLLHLQACSDSQVRWAKSGAKELLCGPARCLYVCRILNSSISREAMFCEAGTNFQLDVLWLQVFGSKDSDVSRNAKQIAPYLPFQIDGH